MTTKCIYCSNLIKSKQIETESAKDYIGYCRKHNIKVIDSLCGCRVEGKHITLKNFQNKSIIGQ